MNPSVSQCGNRIEADVLVIGSGIAALIYTLDLLEAQPNVRVVCVTKAKMGDGNSRWAQGGIASVARTEDSIDAHVEDTLLAGDGMCHEPAVRAILEKAPACMARLVEIGVPFDRTKDGDHFDLALEGGHSHRRIYHAGDRTGAVVIDTLVARLRATGRLELLEEHSAVNLISQTPRHTPSERPEVLGAYVLDQKRDLIHTVRAKVTVLATGGAGKTFRFTTNSESVTGDGIAMAYRAGCRVGNLEFVQFHPTLLYHAEVNDLLISEAVRGEGGLLRLPGSGERFMERYDATRKELATRDVVTRAIFTEMEASGLPHVYLDMRHHDREFIEQKFPAIDERLRSLGLDMAKEMVPVVPAAHYLCGGVLADPSGRTDLGRLLVIGEAAFTGLHGANRLASNSLIEGMVMGHLAAGITPGMLEPVTEQRDVLDWDSQSVSDDRRSGQMNAHWSGLRHEMTSYAGIVRTEEGLQDLLSIIALRREMIEGYYWSHVITRDLIELRNIALLAELIAQSALHRRESRGGHYREDYPDRVPDTRDTILRFQEQYPTASSHFERPHA